MLSTFAALLLSATLLTACGEEVQESADNDNNNETVTETTTGENCTLFSTGDDGTRTALGFDRKFYWSEGDQIYVNTEGSQYDEYSEVVFTKQWAELRLAESSANLATDYSGVEVELAEVPANSGNLSFRAYASLTDNNARVNCHNVTSLTNTLNFSDVTLDPIQWVSIVWRTEGTASLKIRHVYLIKKDGTKEEVTPTNRNACTITPVLIPVSSGSTDPQYARTSKSTLDTDRRTADFVLEGVSLTAPKCSVVYIGNGTTAATPKASELKVKIEATQTQAAWGDSAHIGRAGDCGVAEATKVGGKYTFNLRHKASYLVFQPYRRIPGSGNPDWKLMKIEIIANGTTLAGTYDFGTGELVGTGSSNTIEFNCGTDGFPLEGGAASTAKSCFVVIQPSPPGTTHELTIRYTVKVTKRPDVLYFDANGINENGINEKIFIIDKPIAARSYNANVVTTIKHKLEAMMPTPQYYQWDALNPYTSATGAEYNNSITRPTNASEIAAQSAKQSCKDMPNINEMYWYLVNGDPHWDETTLWSIDGGLTEFTIGLWLKTKATILAEGKTFRDDIGKDGVDMRLTYKNHTVVPSRVVLPVADRSKYFFLPALGSYSGGSHYDWRCYGYYWSSSPYPGPVSYAYYLLFGSNYAYVNGQDRSFCFSAGSQWFR